MKIQSYAEEIFRELDKTLANISGEQGDILVDLILASKRIFTAGAGRSGLAVRAFAMRLMHMGFEAYVAGETITPGITSEDLLIIGSGSGSTGSLCVMAEKAKSFGTRIGLITIRNDSPIAALSDAIITIPAPTPKIDGDTGFKSIQPMGSLFEQCLFILLDTIILRLMEKNGMDSTTMFLRHANLE